VLLRRLDTLYPVIKSITGDDEETITKVIDHYFTFIRSVITNLTYPSIPIPNLGIIYMSKVNYFGAVRLLIKNLRSEKMSITNKTHFRTQFKILWKAKYLMYKYYQVNKSLNPFIKKSNDEHI